MTSTIHRDGLWAIVLSGALPFAVVPAPVAAGNHASSLDADGLAQTIQAPVQIGPGVMRPGILPDELTQRPPVLACEAQVRVIGEGPRRNAILSVIITNVGTTKAASGTRIGYSVESIPTSNGFLHRVQDNYVLTNPLFPGERLVFTPFVPDTAIERRYGCSASQVGRPQLPQVP
ncbi:MAG: hypothetical protein VKK62_08575 [Synechococcaceae cyanobacterium]|nr:hypothetical protein [Synechococcaceae cyanobacterium]